MKVFNNLLIYLVLIILCVSITFSYSTSNQGNIWVRGWINQSNASEDVILNGEFKSNIYAPDYNVTASNISGTYIYEDGNRVLTNLSISGLNVSNANQTTFWGSLISYIPRWFWNNNSMLDLNETLLNSSIDNRIVASNTSMKGYVDTRFTNNNQTLIALDVRTNTSMKAYVDNQDTIYNESAKVYGDNTFINKTEEGNLNVNHSDSTTSWASVSGFATRWLNGIANVLTFNDTLLNSTIDDKINSHNQTLNSTYVTELELLNNNNSVITYIDAQDIVINSSGVVYTDAKILDNNNSVVTYIDSQDDIYNSSNVVYTNAQILANNNSVVSYIDSQDVSTNISIKAYTDNTFITIANEGNLNVNHSDSTTSWASVSGFATRWLNGIANVLTFNDTLLNSTIDDKINSHNQTLNSTYVTELELLDNNNSVISYIDSQDTIYNSSMKTYVDAQDIIFNSSMKEYVDYEILINNDSVVTYIGMVAYDTITNYSDTQFSNMTAEYITGGRLSINNTAQFYGNTFIKDIEGSTHHINVDLENLDELNANVFFTPLHIETVYNESGYFAKITTEQNEPSITVNIANSSGANNYRLQYNNITLQLNNGTNETPVLNRVYVYLDSGVPTWDVSTSKPTFKHAMAARILVGDTGKIYVASLVEDSQNGFVKRTQRTFRKQGLTYESGFDFTASASDLDIGIGNFINSIYDQNISFNSTISTDGFYEVNISGDYVMLDGFSDIEQYSDGNPIGVNKYFNVVFGITPYDGYANIYAVIQKKPIVEYTSVIRAYADSSNTLTVYPDDTFLRISFLPIARMIIKRGDEAQILPNTLYAEDYRGGIAGGVSSGGGIAEADPLSIHKDGSIELTSSWDVGAYDILANSFNGSWNGSSLYYLSSEVDTEILNNNDTIISYIIAQILNNNNTLNSSYVTTLEQLSNNLSLEAYIDAQDGIYNVSSALYTNEQILENNASVIDYVVALDVATNTSMKAYVDGLPAGFTNGSSIEVFNINSTGLIYGNGSQLTNLPTGGDAWGDLVDADIVPDVDNTRDLGNNSNLFSLGYIRNLYTTQIYRYLDPDTYITFSGSNDMSFFVGGIEYYRVTLDTTSNVFNELGYDINFRVESDNNESMLYVDAGLDKVGIGTSTPDSELTVVGNLNVSGLIYGNGSQLTNLPISSVDVNKSYVDSQDGVYNVSSSLYTNERILDNNASVLSYVVALDVATNTSMKAYVDSQDGIFNVSSALYTNERILDNNASMIAYVDAASGSDVNKTYVDSYVLENNNTLPWVESGTNVYLKTLTNNVGIGTTTPTNTLSILTSTDWDGIFINNTDSNTAARITLQNDAYINTLLNQYSSDFGVGMANSTGISADHNLILISDGDTGNNGSANISFRVGGYEEVQEAMRITSGGNVGIGTSTPAQKLDVQGNISVLTCINFEGGGSICSGS